MPDTPESRAEAEAEMAQNARIRRIERHLSKHKGNDAVLSQIEKLLRIRPSKKAKAEQ